MQSRPTFLVPLVACALLSGCTGVSPTRLIGDSIGAAGGALIGHTLGKGNPLATSLGAGAGVLLSETVQSVSTAAHQKAYTTGYEKGRSDAAKARFQSLVAAQRNAPQSDDASHVRLIEVPLPERQVNGVILAPSTATLRIQE